MSVLVGDVLVRVRNLVPDPPQTLGTPTAPTLTPSASGGTLPTGTLYVVATGLNQWGETTASTESSATVTGPSGSVAVAAVLPPGSTSGRAYYSSASGGENQFIPLNASGAGTITSLTAGTGANPPFNASAWNPDTDGGFISAFDIYKWLNQGLDKLCTLRGGILDENGVAVAAGAAEFTLPGRWLRLTDTWHNGWMTLPERADYTWLQSTVQGIPGIVTLWKNSATQVLGLWPQPSVVAATTTLSQNVALTDTVMNVASATGFIAPGLAQVDNEVFAFTSVANSQLGLLVRGQGGSVPAAHTSGAAVSQLIFRFRGRRMATIYSPGQASVTLDLPHGWDQPLDLYLLSKFKLAEQAIDEALKLEEAFDAAVAALPKSDDRPISPRQLGGIYPMGGASQVLADVMSTVIVN